MDDLAALLADIERQHLPAAQDEEARLAAQKQIARLNARTPRRGGADLAAGERDDDDFNTADGSTLGTDGAACAKRSSGDAQDSPDDLQEQHARHDRMVAAEAPPPVPGHLADSQRSQEVDPYSPDPRLYDAEWMAEFWRRVHEAGRRCDAAIMQMNAAIEAAQQGREARP